MSNNQLQIVVYNGPPGPPVNPAQGMLARWPNSKSGLRALILVVNIILNASKVEAKTCASINLPFRLASIANGLRKMDLVGVVMDLFCIIFNNKAYNYPGNIFLDSVAEFFNLYQHFLEMLGDRIAEKSMRKVLTELDQRIENRREHLRNFFGTPFEHLNLTDVKDASRVFAIRDPDQIGQKELHSRHTFIVKAVNRLLFRGRAWGLYEDDPAMVYNRKVLACINKAHGTLLKHLDRKAIVVYEPKVSIWVNMILNTSSLPSTSRPQASSFFDKLCSSSFSAQRARGALHTAGKRLTIFFTSKYAKNLD